MARVVHQELPSEPGVVSVRLWPHLTSSRTTSKYVEPDVWITYGDIEICVEAKYKSGFGSYANAAGGPPLHQLTVQAEALAHHAPHASHRRLFVVAVTDEAGPPEAELLRARNQLVELGVQAVHVSWLGWHQIAGLLAGLDELQPHEVTLRNDVLDYMTWRRVATVYEPIKADDWARMRQGTEITDRVAPATAEFQRDLAARLAKDNIMWGNPQQGVNIHTTTSLQKSSAWFPGRISFPWRPSAWSTSAVAGFYPGLYTCFDFRQSVLEVGFYASSGGAANTNTSWIPRAEDLVVELNGTDFRQYELVIASNLLAPPQHRTPLGDLDSKWLVDKLHNLSGSLMLRKCLSGDSSVQQAHEHLVELRDIIDKNPTVKGLLSNSGPVGPVSAS